MVLYAAPNFNPYYRAENNQQLITDIAKAINGEYSAIVCYEQLARMAPTEKERSRIIEIRNDEIRHYQLFSQIYSGLSGNPPAPQITEKCPSAYKEGLTASLQDEQETVDFYNELADKAQDPYIKEQFRRAAADEQNHAVWFLYFYTRLCCDKS